MGTGPINVIESGYNIVNISEATWFVVEEWTVDEFSLFPYNSELAARSKFSECKVRIPSVLYKGRFEVDCDTFGEKGGLGEAIRNDIRLSFLSWYDKNITHDTRIFNGDEKICCVCKINPNDYVFIPCLHMVCCETCSERIFHSSKKQCPLCNKTIENIYKI